MKNAQKFKHTNIDRQRGELARLKVVQGPDYGAIYVLTGARASIGRGEDCDIVISDLKASRFHAEMQAAAGGGWVIKDRGSANGILYNGKTTREARLKINDTITLGETTLEFITAEVATMMLVAPPRTMDQVQAEQKNLADHQKKMAAMGFGNASSAPGLFQNKRVLLIGGVLVAGFLLIPNEDHSKKAPPQKKEEDIAKDLAVYLPNVEINKSSDTLFKDGLREYFDGNYNRARTQFETVLQISPGHPLATLYLENCDSAVKENVKLNLENGKKSFQAGRLRDAKAHFERVMRLLYKDQSNPAYIEAKEQLEKVSVAIGGEPRG